jgi:tetratricopeptide (TPR) repeat protein
MMADRHHGQMKETTYMMTGRRARERGTGLVLALAAAVLATACASAAPGEPGVAGERPRDDADTRAASMALAQAALADDEAARSHYEQAVAAAHRAIERDPQNPRAYMLAGQAAVGAGDWVMADTMFDRAEELHPRFAEQIEAEREEGWVMAYNLGAEAMNAADYERAYEMFTGADRLYDQRPEARLALGVLYSREGDTEGAMRAYRRALEILDRGPPEVYEAEQRETWEEDRQAATFNLANMLAQTGQYGEAADLLERYLEQAPNLDAETRLQATTARATFLGQAGRTDEAEALYQELMERGQLGAAEYFQIGIGLFNAGEYERAADAFRTSAEMNPVSRDAFLNLVQSLYTAALDLEDEPQTAERDQRIRALYTELLEAADRVHQFDPLNRNLLSFRLRAMRGLADLSPAAEAERLARRSQEVFRQYQEQAYEVSDISMSFQTENQVQLRGLLTNLAGTPGERVALRFTMLDARGNTLGTTTAEVTVPALEDATQFSATATVQGELSGWRYELAR